MEPLPEHLLHGVPRLENVSLHDCNLTHIHDSFFSFSPNITHLRLENNRLSMLPEKIFRNNTMLKELNLNFNSIQELPENLFPNQKYLEKLFLFKNNISVLPNGIFKYTRNIKTLVLGGNKLQTIGRAIFRDLPNLEELDLSKNNLTYFSLDFNEYIKFIDLSYNNLTQMPSINWLQHLKLEKLNMNYNKLTYIEIPVLYSTNRRNPTLNIAHNNIKTVSVQDILINDQTIKDLPSKDYESYVETSVSLASNPFSCDCRIYSFYDYLKGNNEAHKRSVRFTRTQDLTCQEPKNLANQAIVQLRPNQFTCDLNDNCSTSCHCYIRAEDNSRVVNCSNLKLKSLPTSIPLNTSVLYFQGNMLSSMGGFNSQIWENLTDLYLDGNQVTSLDHWSIPIKLKHLSLKGNQLKYLTSTFMDLLSVTKGFQISLSDNPWNCNCSTVTFKKWLTEHYQFVKDVKNVMCANRLKLNGTLMRKPILMIPDDVICPISDWPYKVQLISVTVICVILALLLFVVSVLYYRNKQTVIAYVYIHMHNVFMCFFNEEDIDEDKTFDAFVSYSSSDRDVALRLIEELEDKEPHFKLCIHERNWIAGNQISWNIFNSVHNSRKTILVISKEFLESMWFQVEFHTAYYQMLEDKIDRLIIIVKGELPQKDTLDKDLQYLLSTKTYLVWEEKWFWEKLKYAMPHKKQQMLQNDVLALKDRPASEKIKTVENQIAIFSSGGNKTTGKVQEVVQNGTNKALNLVNKETMNKK
ncbi:Protein toll, partial [Stegodyphus mimosarum]